MFSFFNNRPSWTTWATLALLASIAYYVSGGDSLFLVLAVVLAIPAILGGLSYLLDLIDDLRKTWASVIEKKDQEDRGRS